MDYVKRNISFEEHDPEVCNNLFENKKQFKLSNEHMQEVKKNYVEADIATKLLGKMPSQEEIQQIYENRLKCKTYQIHKYFAFCFRTAK